MQLSATVEIWPIDGIFSIARGSKSEVRVVVVELQRNDKRGRGECVPYLRYGETPESVIATLEKARKSIGNRPNHLDIERALPPGAARNAVDCALWDLEAKEHDTTIWKMLKYKRPRVIPIAYTISLDSPGDMEKKASIASALYPLLKIKLGGEGDVDRLRAVRRVAPSVRLIVDANESWRADFFYKNLAACEEVGVELIEQPLPAHDDALLAEVESSALLCADESAHTAKDISKLKGKYGAVNIKLDKTGGLAAAIKMKREAKDHGLKVMVGSMVSTSLSIAPATVLAHDAEYADLDGALLLARDRNPRLRYQGSGIIPTDSDVWG
jgi:L-Ala-D/L-Glu epimerase